MIIFAALMNPKKFQHLFSFLLFFLVNISLSYSQGDLFSNSFHFNKSANQQAIHFIGENRETVLFSFEADENTETESEFSLLPIPLEQVKWTDQKAISFKGIADHLSLQSTFPSDTDPVRLGILRF